MEVDHECVAAPAALNHDPRCGNTSKHKVSATTRVKAVTSNGDSNVWQCHSVTKSESQEGHDQLVNSMRMPINVQEQICIMLEGIHGHGIPIQVEHIC